MRDDRLAELAAEKWMLAVAVEQYRQDLTAAEEYRRNHPEDAPDARKREKRLVLLTAQIQAQTKRQASVRRRRRLRTSLLMAALIAALLAATAFAERMGWFRFLSEQFEQYSLFWSISTPLQKPEGWDSEYYPTWLPDGFEIETVSVNPMADIIVYKGSNDARLTFALSHGRVSYADTENMKMENIQVCGFLAELYSNEDHTKCTLVIPISRNSIVVISGEINPEEAKEIGEKINQ